jgi:hypothetical protein
MQPITYSIGMTAGSARPTSSYVVVLSEVEGSARHLTVLPASRSFDFAQDDRNLKSLFSASSAALREIILYFRNNRNNRRQTTVLYRVTVVCLLLSPIEPFSTAVILKTC